MRTHAVNPSASRSRRRPDTTRPCNLCGEPFSSACRFDRFCQACKQGSELYHFHETLPSAPAVMLSSRDRDIFRLTA